MAERAADTSWIDDLIWDPGQQPERTALAWQRTYVAMLLATLAVLRLALLQESTLGVVAALSCAAVCVACVLTTVGAYRTLISRLGSGQPIEPMGSPALLAVAVTSLSVSTSFVAISL